MTRASATRAPAPERLLLALEITDAIDCQRTLPAQDCRRLHDVRVGKRGRQTTRQITQRAPPTLERRRIATQRAPLSAAAVVMQPTVR